MAPGGTSAAAEDFDALYRACRSRLTGQLLLLTGDAEEARDCVQEALERAWTRWDRVRELDDPEGWVRAVARRLAVSRWRRARTAVLGWHRRHAGEVTAWDGGGRAVDDRLLVVRALQALPVDQRHALVLHHLCDMDVAAVAAETGTNPSTVRSRLARGRRALAAALPGVAGLEDDDTTALLGAGEGGGAR